MRGHATAAAPAPVVAPTFERIATPDGYALISDQVPAATRAKLVTDLTRAKRTTPPMPVIPRCPWADAGKASTADRAAIIGAMFGRRGGLERWRDHVLTPRWRSVESDGHAAVLAPTAAPVDLAGRKPFPLPDQATAAAQIGADFWRAYARVRTCRMERSGAIRFAWTADGVRISAGNVGASGAEATEFVDVATGGAAWAVVLNDRYLWPLRGRAWTVRTAGGEHDPVWLESADGIAVLIMAMRA